MLTAVGHLENYGYVKRLRTSTGEQRVLLQPERLNNLASSFVLEARRNPKGLGAVEEKRLLAGGYDFPEIRDLIKPTAMCCWIQQRCCSWNTTSVSGRPIRCEWSRTWCSLS